MVLLKQKSLAANNRRPSFRSDATFRGVFPKNGGTTFYCCLSGHVELATAGLINFVV